MYKFVMISGIVAIALAGCATGSKPLDPGLLDAKSLSAVHLRSMIVGHTVNGVTPDGQPYKEVFNPDGTLQGNSVERSTGAPITDSGHWQLVGDKMCITWETWQNGAIRCHKMLSLGDRLWWSNGDALSIS